MKTRSRGENQDRVSESVPPTSVAAATSPVSTRAQREARFIVRFLRRLAILSLSVAGVYLGLWGYAKVEVTREESRARRLGQLPRTGPNGYRLTADGKGFTVTSHYLDGRTLQITWPDKQGRLGPSNAGRGNAPQ